MIGSMKGSTMIRKPIVILALLLGSCANPYAQFFNPSPTPVPPDRVDAAAAAAPAIYNYSANPDADAQAMMENGFGYLGASSFNTGQRVTKSELLDQAKKVGAAAILVKSQFTNSVSSAIPFSVYHPGQLVTSNTNGNFNAYNNSGGSAYGNYSGTTTTQLPGQTSTTYIPYTVNRFNYMATYWVKLKPPRLGVGVVDLPQDVRQRLQRNTGAMINFVVNGSPAFKANLLRSDIITSCNGTDVTDAKQFLSTLAESSNELQLVVLRGNESKTIQVTTNSP